jgi:hypothetical protein
LASCHCRDIFPTKTGCSKNDHGGTSADLSEALAFWRAGPDRWLEEVLDADGQAAASVLRGSPCARHRARPVSRATRFAALGRAIAPEEQPFRSAARSMKMPGS